MQLKLNNLITNHSNKESQLEFQLFILKMNNIFANWIEFTEDRKFLRRIVLRYLGHTGRNGFNNKRIHNSFYKWKKNVEIIYSTLYSSFKSCIVI